MERLLDKIRKDKTANQIMKLLSGVGIDKILLRVLYRYYEKHPTESMKQSADYFRAHKEDRRVIMHLLSDEKSRQVWKRMVAFRMTAQYKLHPGKELPQYFVEDIIKYGKNEIFIDCGGFDGITSMEFMKQAENAGGGYQRVVIFEPDRSNSKLLKKNLVENSKVLIFQKGVWDKNTRLAFSAEGTSSSKIIEKDSDDFHTDTIQVVAMDHVEECQNATFIKMDLEGSEMMALKGAENIIRNNRPKLAVCIYHSDQDMVEIIKYIHQLVPEYRLYVRQHSDSYIETVLYAVI